MNGFGPSVRVPVKRPSHAQFVNVNKSATPQHEVGWVEQEVAIDVRIFERPGHDGVSIVASAFHNGDVYQRQEDVSRAWLHSHGLESREKEMAMKASRVRDLLYEDLQRGEPYNPNANHFYNPNANHLVNDQFEKASWLTPNLNWLNRRVEEITSSVGR